MDRPRVLRDTRPATGGAPGSQASIPAARTLVWSSRLHLAARQRHAISHVAIRQGGEAEVGIRLHVAKVACERARR